MLTGLEKIEQLVEKYPCRKLQTIMHLVNETTLQEVHKRQVANKTSGIDEICKNVYGENLSNNVKELVRRMKTFQYKPQPVKRVYIPKDTDKTKRRPLGIPAYEDRLVQGVMSDILNIIYEPKFYNFSYGFRPNKDCHQAINYLDGLLMGKTKWVVDVDIEGFFDNVDHEWMIKFIEHEIEDENFIRYIKRFLKAGIMEDKRFEATDRGVPQGGLISPILANVYLHYVIDDWFVKKIVKKSYGMARMVRYADDIVFCFEEGSDAKEFYNQLRERLAKFGLKLSESKSKIIKSGRMQGSSAEDFDFLGFTFKITKSRKGNYFAIHITSQKKLKIKKQIAKEWLKRNMHLSVDILIKKLNLKLRGHYNYYGVSHNIKRMRNFYLYVKNQLKKVLNRRSQKDKTTWKRYIKILEYNPLIKPTITRPLW